MSRLTTHSSGPSYVTRVLLPLRVAAQRERYAAASEVGECLS